MLTRVVLVSGSSGPRVGIKCFDKESAIIRQGIFHQAFLHREGKAFKIFLSLVETIKYKMSL